MLGDRSDAGLGSWLAAEADVIIEVEVIEPGGDVLALNTPRLAHLLADEGAAFVVGGGGLFTESGPLGDLPEFPGRFGVGHHPGEHLGITGAGGDDALESGHPSYIASVLGTIARSEGMSKIAEKTGVNRQALYTALSENGNPTLETLLKVMGALGIKLKCEVDMGRAA